MKIIKYYKIFRMVELLDMNIIQSFLIEEALFSQKYFFSVSMSMCSECSKTLKNRKKYKKISVRARVCVCV